MRRLFFHYSLLIALIAVTLPCLSRTATANPSALTQATAYFRSGRYAEALNLFQKVEAADRIKGVIGASRTWIMTGQYGAAEAIYRKTLGDRPGDPAIISRLAEILSMTGRSDEAMGVLEPVVNNTDAPLRSLVRYGQLLQQRGRRDEAAAIFQRALSLNDSGQVIESEDLAMLAVASRSLERFHDANRFFRQALRADPENLEAEVLWGDLFREKYNTAEARKSYATVLKRNPKHVPALVGMARTLHRSAAQNLLEDAFEINAAAESALEALAEIRSMNRTIFGEDRVINRFNRPDLLMLVAHAGDRPESMASDAEASDNFGSSVAFDGNTMVVGANNDDDAGDNSGSHVSAMSAHDSGYRGIRPPDVTATEGDHTTHVAVTWTAETGATHYKLWRYVYPDTSTLYPMTRSSRTMRSIGISRSRPSRSTRAVRGCMTAPSVAPPNPPSKPPDSISPTVSPGPRMARITSVPSSCSVKILSVPWMTM